jgi:hypothetical protein
MARQSNEFALAWESLSGSDTGAGWRTIPVTGAGTCALSAGRHFPGNQESLLVGFTSVQIPVAEKFPEGQGFVVEHVSLSEERRTWIALTRKESGGIELFMAMICDITDLLDAESDTDATRLLRIFLGRVRAWQEFMRQGSEALSHEAEVGLVGELMVLGFMLESGMAAASAIEAWVGPLDGIQDFEIGTGAIEVKTTLAPVGFPTRIGSLEQLDDAIRQPLYIAGLRLRQITTGKTLPDMVDDLKRAMLDDAVSRLNFAERLLRARYYEGHRDQYTRRFNVTSMYVMEVKDNFPRLTMGRVPAGITKATYEINLDRVPEFNVDLRTALEQLGVL